MKLTFEVNNQILVRTDKNKVVADSRNYLYAEFSFLSEDWNGITKTAIFRKGNKPFKIILDEDNTCLVPWEVLECGTMFVSVFGGDLITTNSLAVSIMGSGYSEGETPSEPTPDVYNQILERIKGLEAGSVTDEQIAESVNAYLEDNPISAEVDEEQIIQAVSDYMAENPLDVDNLLEITTYQSDNMLDLADVAETTKNGVTMTVVDEVITLNGTATANTDLNLSSNFLDDGTYTFAYEILEGSFSGTLKYGYQSSAFIDVTTTGVTVDIATHDRTKVRVNSGTVCNNLKIHLWAVSGSEYKDWQPYGGWTEQTLNEDITVKRLEEHIEDSDIHITAQEKAFISTLSNGATVYTDEIADIANKVFQATDNGAIVAVLLTDTHVRPDNEQSVAQYEEMIANISELTEQIPCDGVIHLGDHLNTQWWWAHRDTEDLVYQKYVHDYANMLRKAHAPVYCIQGNHDGGFIPQDDEAGTTGSEYSNHSILYRNLGTVTDRGAVRNTVEDSNVITPYYYVDNELTKTRMIFLSSNMENPTNDVKGYHYDELVWFKNTLDSLTEGWNALLFVHISSARFYSHLKNVDWYIEIINAFNEHRATEGLDSTLSADFSKFTESKIVAEVCGHYHGDSVIYPDNENAKLPCPSIEIDCGSFLVGGGVITSGDFYDENDTNARSYDDITKHLFDVMVYRPDLNKIYMYRFGAGEDREIAF